MVTYCGEDVEKGACKLPRGRGGGAVNSVRNTGRPTIARAALRDMYLYTYPDTYFMDYGIRYRLEVRGER